MTTTPEPVRFIRHHLASQAWVHARIASNGWVHARIAGHLGWWPATGILPLLSGRMRARVTYRGREYRVFLPAESISVTKPKGAEPCPTTF